ncbi:MAG: hypothetical protein ACLGI5_04440 [Thermoleophilia bacterium]
MSAQSRTVLGVVAIVAVMAGFWFLLLAPKRADISAANDQIAQAESRRDAAQASAAQAEQSRASYATDYATVARLGKAVPADDDIASLVYQLESIARANKIDFRAVKLTGTAAAVPAEAAADGADAKEGADESDPSATTAVAPPVVAQPPPGAVVGPAGLLTVPFTLTFDGDYMKLQRLLRAVNALAKNDKKKITVEGRLLTVDGFALAASATGGFPKLKATVSATAYIVPESESTTAATPQGPAGAAAGTSTSTALATPNAQGAGR